MLRLHPVAVYRVGTQGRPNINAIRTTIKTFKLTLAGRPVYTSTGIIPIVADAALTPAAHKALLKHCVFVRTKRVEA